MDVLDLTGRWGGHYRYPIEQPPVSFTAVLTDADGWLVGTTEEIASVGEESGRVITATLQGRREGQSVRFLKLYDGASDDYDAVAYEGQLSADGKEIAGKWIIVGWSGAFVMTRQGEAARALLRETVEKV